MRIFISIIVLALLSGGLWYSQQEPSAPQPDLTGKSSDPDSPQKVGVPTQEIDPQGAAPSLFLPSEPPPAKLTIEQVKATSKTISTSPSPDAPAATLGTGEINPDAVEYYRKKGLLGASKEALVVLGSQTELWAATGDHGLSFEQVGGGLKLTFETTPEGTIHGAKVELSGGGAGARLMTVEMWMTGMGNPWELYWETEQPGPMAGTILTPDGQELHYFCAMASMDEGGALSQPTDCHFMLNQPTPELLEYLQQGNVKPPQKARSRIIP